MAGGIANFLGAWMDGDEKAKDQLMDMMKNAFAMQSTAVTTAGMRQDQRIKTIAEQRTAKLFPSVLQASEAQGRMQTTAAGSAERVEKETIESNKKIEDALGDAVRTLTGILEGRKAQAETKFQEARSDLRVPADLAELEGRQTRGELSKIGAFSKADGFAAQGRAEALEQRKLEAEAGLAADVATARFTPETAERIVRTMETTEKGTQLKAQIDEGIARYMINNNYPNILAEAKTIVAGLEDDVVWQNLLKVRAETDTAELGGGKRLSEHMRLLRIALGEDGFYRYLRQKANIELGRTITPKDVYFNSIQRAYQHINTVTEKRNEGIDPIVFQMSKTMTDEEKAALFGGKEDEITLEELFRSLYGYIRTQKAMLFEEHELRYDDLMKLDFSKVTLPKDAATLAIELIEQNQGFPGYVGEILRGWPKGGLASVNEATVMKNVNSIINARRPDGTQLHPMQWVSQLEGHKDKILAQGSTWGTEKDYNAIITILNVLSTEVMSPEILKGNIPGFPTEGVRGIPGEVSSLGQPVTPAPVPTQPQPSAPAPAQAPVPLQDQPQPPVQTPAPAPVPLQDQPQPPVQAAPIDPRMPVRPDVGVGEPASQTPLTPGKNYVDDINALPYAFVLHDVVTDFNFETKAGRNIAMSNDDRYNYAKLFSLYPPRYFSPAGIAVINSLAEKYPTLERQRITQVALDNKLLLAPSLNISHIDADEVAKVLDMEVSTVKELLKYSKYPILGDKK